MPGKDAHTDAPTFSELRQRLANYDARLAKGRTPYASLGVPPDVLRDLLAEHEARLMAEQLLRTLVYACDGHARETGGLPHRINLPWSIAANHVRLMEARDDARVPGGEDT